MPRWRQQIHIIDFAAPRKSRLPSFLLIDKRSVGTVVINGIPYTYNPELVYTLDTPIDDIVDDYEKKKRRKKVIYIKKKSKGNDP